LKVWNEKKEKNISAKTFEYDGEHYLDKKVVIIIQLVPESNEVANDQIEKEILEESSIPCYKQIKKVTVIGHE